MNKKTFKTTIIVLSITILLLLGLGLSFIQIGKIYLTETDPITGHMIEVKMSGFEAIKTFGFDVVFTNSLFALTVGIMGPSQLNLIKCGIVFSVILTPILFTITIVLISYYYTKFTKPVLNTNTNTVIN